MKNCITLTNISKEYNQREIISNISFNVKKGEIIAIIGPNGCGKTTLLNILSGITKASSGEISKINTDLEFSYIFQNYGETLLPWKNNYENLALPLKIKKINNTEIKKRILAMERIFSFSKNLNLYPYQLSGGQQQILSFMRSLLTNPKILFMDEPFSALDYENNLLLRKHLQDYYCEYKPTIITITHDIEEAVHFANKIIVLSKAPSRIVKIIENKTLYPRTNNFLKSRKFHTIKRKVLDAFEEGCKQ
jgi:NitT/TauT family transport system ATP-binding protein